MKTDGGLFAWTAGAGTCSLLMLGRTLAACASLLLAGPAIAAQTPLSKVLKRAEIVCSLLVGDAATGLPDGVEAMSAARAAEEGARALTGDEARDQRIIASQMRNAYVDLETDAVYKLDPFGRSCQMQAVHADFEAVMEDVRSWSDRPVLGMTLVSEFDDGSTGYGHRSCATLPNAEDFGVLQRSIGVFTFDGGTQLIWSLSRSRDCGTFPTDNLEELG